MKIANNLNNTYAFCFILICSNQTTIGVDGGGGRGEGWGEWGGRGRVGVNGGEGGGLG